MLLNGLFWVPCLSLFTIESSAYNRVFCAGNRNLISLFHSEFKLPMATVHPLANHIVPCEASANHGVLPFLRLFAFGYPHEIFPARGFKILLYLYAMEQRK